MQGTRTLYSITMDGLKMENWNEGINFLAWVDLMSIIITISLAINILFFKKWFDKDAKCDKLIVNIQSLERLLIKYKL